MTHEELGQIVSAIASPGRFFIGQGGMMRLDHQPCVATRWEVFRGHLLDTHQTRETRDFAVWEISFRWPDDAEPQPLISLLFDAPTAVIHVVRSILVYGWQAFESAANVIESREARLWRRELVASVPMSHLTRSQLARELERSLQAAIVGTSRLPITSLESPLPAFSLGRLAYFFGWEGDATAKRATWLESPTELIDRLPAMKTVGDQARLLEVVLRAASADKSQELAEGSWKKWMGAGRPAAALLQVALALFGQLALSPYTGLGERLVATLETWAVEDRLGPAVVADMLSCMLRHLVRHLTAFDLVTFHHRGANYPDALFLDALLKAYLRVIARRPELFVTAPKESDATGRTLRLRRRALRQAWLVRKLYEGHPVPEIPTSPGENLRVLPAGIPRIGDEELLYPGKRRKTLYPDDPIDRWLGEPVQRVLGAALADLGDDHELRELGMATYLDRPLGAGKQPGEVDRTPLLSYEAFSVSLAIDRLRQLRRWGALASTAALDRLVAQVGDFSVLGVPAANLHERERPGVVALEDAQKTADDFVFVRTTTRSLREFCAHFDWRSLRESHLELADWLRAGRGVLLIRDPSAADKPQPGTTMTAFDHEFRAVVRFCWSHAGHAGDRWTIRDGVELPRDGIDVSIPGGGGASAIRLPLLAIE